MNGMVSYMVSLLWQAFMFIKRTKRTIRGKTYQYSLLVRSENTERGPRHRTIASLGKMDDLSLEREKEVVCRVEMALAGQLSILEEDPVVKDIVARIREGEKRVDDRNADEGRAAGRHYVKVDRKEIKFENAREAGPVHVGHQMWQKLGLKEVLEEVGFKKEDCELAEILTLNRLIEPSSEHATPEWVDR